MIASDIVDIVPPGLAPSLRVGWCPGVLRAMRVGDGFLLRVKPRGHRLTVLQGRAIADIAARFGNGALTVTARGNLQIRGVTEAGLPAATEALGALGLLDATPEGEAVRNVVSNPLAGADPGAPLDLSALVAAWENRLAHDPALWRLPAKFAWSVDEGGSLPLGDLGTDVRVTALADPGPARLAVGLAGSDAQAVIAAADLVSAASRIAEAYLALCAAHAVTPHRMRDLVALCGAQELFAHAGLPLLDRVPAARSRGPDIGCRRAGPRSFVGASPAFGLLDAATLRDVVDGAATAGADGVRLTPWRGLIVAGLEDAAAVALARRLAATPLILDPADARLRIAACVGVRGCVRGTTDVPADALRLASLSLPGPLHVSGCAKGCARREAARATLVGRAGRYDLVREGRAGDAPCRTGLPLDALLPMLPPLLEAGS